MPLPIIPFDLSGFNAKTPKTKALGKRFTNGILPRVGLFSARGRKLRARRPRSLADEKKPVFAFDRARPSPLG